MYMVVIRTRMVILTVLRTRTAPFFVDLSRNKLSLRQALLHVLTVQCLRVNSSSVARAVNYPSLYKLQIDPKMFAQHVYTTSIRHVLHLQLVPSVPLSKSCRDSTGWWWLNQSHTAWCLLQSSEECSQPTSNKRIIIHCTLYSCTNIICTLYATLRLYNAS